MELLQLKYFLMVAKYEHMTRAANELHIVQPALSQSVGRLEDELGVKLFRKNGRNISLTNAGVYFQEKISAIIDELDNISDNTRKLGNDESRTIRIHISAASLAVTRAIILYKKEHPDVNFQLMRSSEEYGCDISIYSGKADEMEPEEGFTIDEEVFLAVSDKSELARKNSIRLQDIEDEDMLGLNKSRPFRITCDEFCKKKGVSPSVVFEADSPESIKDLIAMGMGVGFWPAFSWGRITDEPIKLLKIRDIKCERNIVIRSHAKDNLEEHRDFIRYMKEYLINLSQK